MNVLVGIKLTGPVAGEYPNICVKCHLGNNWKTALVTRVFPEGNDLAVCVYTRLKAAESEEVGRSW